MEDPHAWINVRTKHGRETHKGWPGSSVTYCGHWMKYNGRDMITNKPVTCMKCLTGNGRHPFLENVNETKVR